MPIWLLKYLPHLAVVALLAGGAFALHHKGYVAGLAKGEARLEAALARQARDAFRAREMAVEAVRREGAAAVASAEKARQKAANAAVAWQRRYRESLARSPECSKWSLEPVVCPLPDAPTAPQPP